MEEQGARPEAQGTVGFTQNGLIPRKVPVPSVSY